MVSTWKIFSGLFLILYNILISTILAFIPKSLRYKNIADEIVLITGGGNGIGRQLAILFAKQRAKIVLWDINFEAAVETVNLIKNTGGEAFPFYCDVSKRECVYETAEKVKKEIGKVNILINNAGIVTGKSFCDCPDHMIQKTFEVNALAHFWTCKAFLPDMMNDNHGHIVFISSMGGLSSIPKLTDYCASKHAVIGFEESLRLELALEGYSGIHSTVVCPIMVNTKLFEGVKSGILPLLSPEYVAKEIMSAVLVNQEVLMIPKGIAHMMLIIKAICPPPVLRIMMYMTDFENPMADFKGAEIKQE